MSSREDRAQDASYDRQAERNEREWEVVVKVEYMVRVKADRNADEEELVRLAERRLTELRCDVRDATDIELVDAYID